MKKFYLISILLMLINMNLYAHGTKYKILHPKYVTIQATFENDTPMSDSDILIFAPGSTKITDKAKTDSNGIFKFSPNKHGQWILQVRDKGGHGMRINLEVNESLQIVKSKDHENMSYMQKIIMAACVIWGFVGTALYFMRKN